MWKKYKNPVFSSRSKPYPSSSLPQKTMKITLQYLKKRSMKFMISMIINCCPDNESLHEKVEPY